MDDIADAAGVTRGLVHHYCGSKRELYLNVVERAVRVPPGMPLIPPSATGGLDDVVGPCVDAWLDLIENAGGLWRGGSGVADHSTSDLDAILNSARDDLVDRIIDELPIEPTNDPELLRASLRCFAAFAQGVSDEWLVRKSITREQAASLLRGSFLDVLATAAALDAVPVG